MSEHGDARLARRYRRLLAAYPRWHRRLHGPDMVRTLLDAATDDGGLSRREAAVLVLDGLRCRFRVPAALIAVAAMVGVVAASAVGAAAGWIGWQADIAPYPTVRQAAELAAPVLPAGRPTSTTHSDQDFVVPNDLADQVLIPIIGDPDPETGGVTLDYHPRHRASGQVLQHVRRSLTGRGWHVVTVDNWLGGWTLTADRGDYRMEFSYGDGGSSPDEVTVHVAPAGPAIAYLFTLLGALVGLLAGWLVSAAVIAQARRRSPRVRIAALVLAIVGIVVELPACAFTVGITSAGTSASGGPPWWGYHFALARPGAAVGAVLLLVAAALVAGARVEAQPLPATG